MALGHRASETEKYRRSDFGLFKAGVELPLTAENLRSAIAGVGYMLRAYSVASKCDQANEFWGGREMWLHIDSEDVMNAGAAWCRYELAFPCAHSARGTTPAFSPDGSDKPFNSDLLRRRHAELMEATGGAIKIEGGVWALPTIHWWRVTLATQLMSKRNPDGSARDAVVQAHLRWRTASSMEIYARYTPKLYADEIKEAQMVDAATKSQDYPCIDPADAWESMLETERILEEQSKGEKSRKRKAAGDGEPATSASATPAAQVPPAAAPAAAAEGGFDTIDVGEPHGTVRVRLDHCLRGEIIEIPKWRWHMSSDDTVPCSFIGYASSARRFVVRASDDGLAYAFTRAAIRDHLQLEQRRLL
jgi:hypothetical protein